MAGISARQREFQKEYEKLCYRFHRWEVWKDFVVLVACSISNTVDKVHAEERETLYMDTIRKYSREEADTFPRLFALITLGMEEDPDHDFLGELFMLLGLGNDAGGQFFTPYHVCKAMARVSMGPELIHEHLQRTGYVSVNDCACGAGATLIAAAQYLKEIGVNYQQQAIFVGQDIDYTTALMCYIQLSLLGCAGYVHVGNTLTDPMTGHVLFGDGKDTTWYTPMLFSDAWHMKRAAERMRLIFRKLGTPADAEQREDSEKPGNAPQTAPKEPGEEIPKETGKRAQSGAGTATQAPTADKLPEEKQKKPKRAKKKPAPVPEPEPRPEEETPAFTVSVNRKNAGQLMFDFG